MAVTLVIDGRHIGAEEGATILEAAEDAGIHIPTLCHLKGIQNIGACRLCLVEIEGFSKLVPACVTKVAEGMIVHTNTERLKKYRKMIIELLFAERNHVCSVCVSNGNCELQTLAMELGVDHIRFDYLHPNFSVDLSHKLFGYDPHRCILCTRCVRACQSVECAGTLDVAHRGVKSIVIMDMNQLWGESDTCTNCGKCIQACPTGALFIKGVGVSEMVRDRSRLEYIMTARERHQWLV